MKNISFIILLVCVFGNNVLISHAFEDSLIRLPTSQTISVLHFGATGDGISDDTQAFSKAWKQACSSSQDVTLEVPNGGTYLLKPVTFAGPCNSQVTFEIGGDIIASVNLADYDGSGGSSWLLFNGVDNLIVQGGGTIDGRGSVWWQKSCRYNKSTPCRSAPTALWFYNCNNLDVNNLKIQNSQQIHVDFDHCSVVRASYLTVTAPGTSPNTDGIHVADSQNVQISNCDIATGDDCISIVSGSQHVRATDITCGPGHGISIGSLGGGNSAAYVTDITVNGANFTGTTNGVRIKTWEGGSGNANNIRFENIHMNNVENPIIIDQSYCDQSSNLPCAQNQGSTASAVQIRNVTYANVKGTSSPLTDAIVFKCSGKYPCREIFLQDVDLMIGGAACSNVNPQYVGTVSPRCGGAAAVKSVYSGRKLLGRRPAE